MSKKNNKNKNKQIINKEEQTMNTVKENAEEFLPTDNTPVEEGQEQLHLNFEEEVTENTDNSESEVPESGKEVTEPTEEPTEEPKEQDSFENIVSGKICDCQKLNLREEPSMESNIVEVLDVNSLLLIDLASSTEEFFKVEFNGKFGYCVKKFVKVD